ncbi:MAG TPA: hypothetical protein VNW54_01970 [Granulicella sp.]|nr:hypothetical protein [Granulicella sp.]
MEFFLNLPSGNVYVTFAAWWKFVSTSTLKAELATETRLLDETGRHCTCSHPGRRASHGSRQPFGGRSGVSELRLDLGPGYRIYFGKDGERLVILFGGRSKRRQQAAIEAAQALWAEYKRGKREEEE